MYMYDIYIQGTQKIHQLTSPHLVQSVSSAQGPDVVGDVSYHAGTPASWQRSSPHPHHPPHPPQPRRHRYHHPQHHHHPCEHAPPKDHPNEAPSTASVPPVPPTAPAVSAAPVPPTAPAVSSAAPGPPAPPIAPVAPAPVRLSCEWVTLLGVVLDLSYHPP